MITRAIAAVVIVFFVRSGYAQPLGVSLEKFTGAWCGWCPYGDWVLDSIDARLGDKAVVIAWHFDDKFEIDAHDTLAAQVSNGSHPALSVGRTPIMGLEQLHFTELHPWYVKARDRLPVEGPIELDIASMSYDPNTRDVDLLVTLLPQGSETPEVGAVQAVVIITEDDLPEDQKLYAEMGGSLPDLKGYLHRNVARQVVGSVLGDSMWYAWGPGWFFRPYAFTVDGAIDPAKARVNVIVSYQNEKQAQRIVIAKRSPYLPNFAPQSVRADKPSPFEIYPNPASQTLSVTCDDNTDLGFTTVTGSRVLQARVLNNEVDISQLLPGVYFVSATVNGEVVTRRLIVR